MLSPSTRRLTAPSTRPRARRRPALLGPVTEGGRVGHRRRIGRGRAAGAGEGRYGDALRVNLKSSPFVFFKGDGNIAYRPRDWSGTVSIWMRLDPDRDLLPGYSDPLIITPRAWNDAALFVDFTRDDVPRRFRFAAFADRGVWDPGKREWEAVPVAERPMVEITGPRFASDRWTHVAWTWSHFNTGRADGTLACYLDGPPVGRSPGARRPSRGSLTRSPSPWASSSAV